ncbi:thiamine/thiamine pyrophosphate ABC transporter permease ThiP [Amylibacter marinus]|uniref:Thiamine/thiamine pyrophosphate ABC transporter permease ThiP n=2 Tax=Amylibacter marinus TaxID=1475483 RepID=A0ABQ5VVU3_9RHOB|nr:thiamine/thiamine pyrophosphate ABC transporter permease ThiP [Amylibacter marinus]
MGRSFILTLLGAPFILPSIVAVLGLIAVWGRAGYINSFLEAISQDRIDIYGFGGVVLAHIFFNIPLATRLILQGWMSIPAEHFRVAAQLGMSTSDISTRLERPMLRAVIPGAFLLIFLLCISSFAVALALGGGPMATTIELAIYNALRFEFDLSKASQLALIQFGICAFIGTIAMFISQPMKFSQGLDRAPERWDSKALRYRIFDFSVLFLVCGFLFLPLLTIFLRGIGPAFSLPFQVWGAAVNSVLVAVFSALIAVGMALAMSMLIIRIAQKKRRISRIMEVIGFLTLATSPFVIGTGLFVITFPFISPFSIALPVTALVNAAMALPFCLRVVLPAMIRAEDHYGRLADSLGMQTWARFRLAIWPRLRRPTGFAAGLAAALSMGDLGVITLFAPPELETLPLVMYRLMSNYQLSSAAGVALLLILLSITLFWIFDQGGRVEHNIR